MTGLQKLLLLPCLSPLLGVLLVAGLNFNKPVNLKFLTWRSPTWTLGGWMAIGSSAGAIFALSTGLSLPQRREPLRRQVHQRVQDVSAAYGMPPQQEWYATVSDSTQAKDHEQQGPERDLRDPSPTVAVPFRIMRKGTTKHQTNVEVEADHEPTQSHDDASSISRDEDDSWGHSLSEDW